jgi:flagellar protein FlgJ
MNGIELASLEYRFRTPSAPTGAANSGARVLPNARNIDRKSELYAQCEEFESIFVKMMLNEMRKSVDKAGLVDGGYAEDIFEDMLYDEYAKSMTKTARFGLSDQIYLQLAGNR